MPSPRQNRRSAPVRPKDLGVEYSRFSTEDQGSTAEQQAINREIAVDEGIALVASFTDEGVSRSLSDRPGLRQLFSYLEDHPEVGFIIVNELERMTAGVDQRQEITRICKRLRITIVTEDMGRIDPHDEDKMQDADQRAVTAKGEVIKVRRRTRRNLRAKVKAGTTVAMRPPYGVRMKPLTTPDGVELPPGVSMLDTRGRKVRSGQIELHPDEYPWLKKIFEWAYEGKSNEWITQKLTSEGVPTKTGRGAWRQNTIGGILRNPFYKGEMIWGLQETLRDENGKKYLEVRAEDDPGRVTLPSPLGAIIDPEIWDAIETRRQARGNERRATRRTYPPQVLDHRVYCARCGHKMYGRTDNPKAKDIRWRYYCYSMRPGFEALPDVGLLCITGHSMSLKDILKAMAGEPIRGQRPMAVTVVRGDMTTADMDLERRRAEADIVSAEKEYQNAVRLAIKGHVSDEQLEETKAETDRRVAAAREKLADLNGARKVEIAPLTGEYANEIAELAARLADESQPIELRLALLERFGLERVYVDKPNLRLHVRE